MSRSERVAQPAGADLLSVVDALTKPTHTMVGQWWGEGCPWCRERVEHQHSTRVSHPPRIDQLAAAVTDAQNPGTGSSASLASTRNALDADALHLWDDIMRATHDWCIDVGVKPSRDPVRNLRAWYAATLAMIEPQLGFFEKTMRGWVVRIDAHLDPPVQLQVTHSCPVCGADTWEDAEGAVFLHPLVISYRRGEADVLGTSRGLCRACGHVWRRTNELRALAWGIENPDASLQETAGVES